jgi:hypothetical protein
MAVNRTDEYLRPRGYYDNQGNLLKVGFDVINTLPASLDLHKADIATAHGINNYAKIAQEAWIAPTLLNGWANVGLQHALTGYFKDTIGIVHLKGLVKNGTATINTAIFQLPAGYRPLECNSFAVYSNDGGIVGTAQVFSSGEVVFISGGNLSFSLSGITFLAEQ